MHLHITIMERENKIINDFDFSLICEYFASVERQGPGSPEMTIQALNFIDNLTADSRIADIGCGTGTQTMLLAEHTQGYIVGVDLLPEFIGIFNHAAQQLNLQDRVMGMVGAMEDLPFKDDELDLIWAEGAIYNIGFERGMNEWHKFLKTDGYIAVTEISWLTNERPKEINDFWTESYPEIDTISNKVALMQKAGYITVATFVLSENCWTDHFYTPQEAVQETFLMKHKGNQVAEDFVECQRRESQLYHKYKKYYSYVFYIGKKI